MTFIECVLACADNRELLADEATGRLNSDLGQFVAFVHEYVWLRCPEIQGEAAR